MAAPIFAGIMGGMAAGATNAALNGTPLSGILQAATMGGAFGAIGGGLYAAHVPVWAMIGGGAAVATATGGLEGLAHYAAGFAGALAGGYGTSYAKENWGKWFPSAEVAQTQQASSVQTASGGSATASGGQDMQAALTTNQEGGLAAGAQ
jgi:hypothetical protein